MLDTTVMTTIFAIAAIFFINRLRKPGLKTEKPVAKVIHLEKTQPTNPKKETPPIILLYHSGMRPVSSVDYKLIFIDMLEFFLNNLTVSKYYILRITRLQMEYTCVANKCGTEDSPCKSQTGCAPVFQI